MYSNISNDNANIRNVLSYIQVFCIALFLIVICLFSIFPINSLASSNISYTFQENEIYNENNITYSDSYNMREQKQYTEHYNATYSFENVIDGSIPIDWIDASGSNCFVGVSENYKNHNKVLNLLDQEGTTQIADIRTNDFIPQFDGFIEFWCLVNESKFRGTGIYMYDNDGLTRLITIIIDYDDLYYYKSGYILILSNAIKIDIWNHIRIEFYSSNLFNIYINNILIMDDLPFENNFVNGMDYIRFASRGDQSNYEIYIDAIGYSWDNSDETIYNFNSDVIGSQPANWFNDSTYQYDVEVSTPLDIHYKPLNITVPAKFTYVNWCRYIDNYPITTLSWDFCQSDISSDKLTNFFTYYGKYDNYVTVVGIYSDDIIYQDSVTYYVITEGNVKANHFTHIECVLFWNYYDIYVNGTLAKTKASYYTETNGKFDLISVGCQDNSAPYSSFSAYFDNITIEYDNYRSNDNFLPYANKTGLRESISLDFYMRHTNELFQLGDITVPYYNCIDEGAGYNNYNYILEAWELESLGDFQVLMRDNLVIENCNFINYSIYFDFYLNDDYDDSGITIGIFDQQPIKILELFINRTGNLGYLTYNNYYRGLDLDTLLVNNTNYRFDILCYYPLNLTFLDIYTEGVYTQSFIFPLRLNSLSTGVSVYYITIISILPLDNYIRIFELDFWIDKISYSQGIGYDVIDLEGISFINTMNTNIFESISSGNYSIGCVYENYEPTESFNLFNDFYIDTRSISIRNGYFDYTLTINNPSLVFTTFMNYSLSSFSIFGINITNGANDYIAEYFSNVNDNNYNYFYVSGSTLYFVLTPINNNLEYIEILFDIDNIITTNYSMQYRTTLQGSCFAEFRLNFTDDTSQRTEFEYYSNSEAYIISQDKNLNTFSILLTDNDYYNSQEYTVGSIRLITLVYITDIGLVIVTEVLMTVMSAIITIIAPTLFLSYFPKDKEYKDYLVVGLFLLFSIICLATSLIPNWLFFIILISLIALIFTNKD